MDVCQCGRVIEQPETGRKRKWCYICSPKDRRRERAALGSVSLLPVRQPGSEGRFDSGNHRSAHKAGILDSWQGAAAVALAELIDAQRHGASGPGGTIKAHRDAVQYAPQSVFEEDDVIIQLFREN